MANNNSKKELTEKIAEEEGLSSQEISKDISNQMGDQRRTTSIEQIARKEGLNPRELKEDFQKQMRVHKNKDSSKNIWIILGIIAALFLAAWWLYKTNQ